MYRMEIIGRAAHPGVDPGMGANATLAMMEQIMAIVALARPACATTVTPTVAHAGTVLNVVPERAEWGLDVRAHSTEELVRVDAGVREVLASAPLPSTVIDYVTSPPLPTTASADLFARAQRLAARLGLPSLEGVTVGGASDGNYTAALGVPTLDGLGAVGDGIHARHEHVAISAMPLRAALAHAVIVELVEEYRRSPPQPPVFGVKA